MQNYNYLQKFLHGLCLGNNLIKKSLFEVEKLIYYKKNDLIKHSNHVFISGLPRSGTTALLNFIYESKQFSSFCYEDMPFIMSPNIYSKINKKKEIQKKERYHNDGILFDLNTPEAFDEVFFLTINKKDIEKEFERFVSLILKKNNKIRYLSKNNFNYRRLDFLKRVFPKSILLIPFRKPLEHANSLLNQHINFLKIQKDNPFILKYMNYLGHFEFGINHKSWNKSENFKLDNINYWIEQWLLFYDNLYKKSENIKNLFFICYEKLDNQDYMNKIKKRIELNLANDFIFKKSHIEIDQGYENKLLNKANDIYKNLVIESEKL